MKVIFTGDPLELERGESLSRLSTTMYGKVFPMSAEVDISDLSDVQKRKLMNNSHFRVVGVDAAPEVSLILPVSTQAATQAAPSQPAESETTEEAPRPAKRSSKG